MKILIADDDRINRRLLEVSLAEWGYEVVVASDGAEAWAALQAEDAPALAVLDWMMPEVDGVEVVRRVRSAPEPGLTYLILLTAKGQLADVVAGLEAGADDYIVKPFEPQELRTRVGVGVRLLDLQRKLLDRARELEAMHVRVAEEERFRDTVADMSDAILTLDADWRLTTANRAACVLLDLGDDWPGRPLEEVLAPFSVSVPVADLRGAEERVSAFDVSRPDTHPPLLLDARLSRRRDAAGSLLGAVLIVRDVTTERLSRHVQAGFMTAMPHKLRTPLQLLVGYLNLTKRLSNDELLERWPRISEVWEEELRQLIGMVQQLLDFERLTTEDLAAELRPTEVAAVAAEAVARVRERQPGVEAEFTVEIAPDAARVNCRADHLAFVLQELLGNALKFADKPPVQVSLRAVRAGTEEVRFTVSDNGPGIPHEYYDRIFEDFVQVEEYVTGQIPGWGVGLRMVRYLVEAYEGAISVTSRLGAGSEFTFTLPAAPA